MTCHEENDKHSPPDPATQFMEQALGPPRLGQEPQDSGISGAALADDPVVAKTDSNFSSALE